MIPQLQAESSVSRPSWLEWRGWKWAALTLFCATAILSIGFHHLDEHFQIIEYAHWKVFGVHEWALPWEFKERMRPSVQPWIAVGVAKAMLAVGLYEPFWWTTILRLAMAVLWWWVLRRMVRVFGAELSANGRKLFAVASFALWWVPYISVRFSGESFSAAIFMLAMTLVEGRPTNKTRKAQRMPIATAAAGALMGLSVSARPQMAFAVIGFGVWMLAQRRSFAEYFVLGITAAAVVVACCMADWAFYGERVFTAYNYWHQNISKGMAASFGVEPWWWYVKAFVMYAVPPLSLVLLGLFAMGLWRKMRHPLAAAFIAFVVAHSVTAHKEMRFMFPMSAALIFLSCAGLDGKLRQWWAMRPVRIAAIILVCMNGLLLLYRCMAPTREEVGYYRYIYRHAHAYDSTLYFVGENPFTQVSVPIIAYRRLDVREVELRDYSGIDSALQASPSGRVLFLDPSPTPAPALAAYRPVRLYSLIPAWAKQVNFGDWLARSEMWTIYRIERLAKPR